MRTLARSVRPSPDRLPGQQHAAGNGAAAVGDDGHVALPHLPIAAPRRCRGNQRRGTVFTQTTNAHPYNPTVPVPYNISIVELPEQAGLRFTTNVVDCPPEDVHIGMPVRVQFEQHGEVFVPVFVPDDAGVRPPS